MIEKERGERKERVEKKEEEKRESKGSEKDKDRSKYYHIEGKRGEWEKRKDGEDETLKRWCKCSPDSRRGG